tara:strand:+ start:74 stop:226 length:153 start_codon:yes stop_codon:yes gene_type:complete
VSTKFKTHTEQKRRSFMSQLLFISTVDFKSTKKDKKKQIKRIAINAVLYS